MLTLVAIGVIGVVLLVSWIWGSKAKKKRREALTVLATELGFKYKEVSEKFIYDYAFGISLFPDRENRRAENLMDGTTSGMRAAIFDFVYETEGVDNSSGTPITSTTVHTQTAAAFESPQHHFPAFEVSKKGLLSGLTKHAKFESNPEFAEHFKVTGSDLGAVQRVFNPAVIQALVSRKPNGNIHLSGERTWLVFWASGGTLGAEKWRGFLEESAQLASEFFRAAEPS